MKKMLAVAAVILALSVSGCGNKNSEYILSLSDRLHLIQGYDKYDGLYYDEVTGIVYIWNGKLDWTYSDTVPSPYYAYNGKPYRYDSYLGKLAMIEDE